MNSFIGGLLDVIKKSRLSQREFDNDQRIDRHCREALDILEGTGSRCVPILDESDQIFRGNIYKMHIYRHKANGGDMDLPVTHLLKNANKIYFVRYFFF